MGGVRFTTLDASCRTLDCQHGDVLRWVPDDADGGWAAGSPTRAGSCLRLRSRSPPGR
ncbi:helix-turn-helix domain-containing protein [Streptomyces sp. NPDC090045]|uniref:helix-turn-helix domain-containing protein n=1 Tax=Streptomyces sp. NPDC090045 TaxID=3365927 RepID=UPI003820D4F1